ncbi:MAG: FAD-dependent oxidoreductase, partial [Candidatus Aureabacteria bacterium]|nr:FAD-dependent oxidoreductase [Candidatus Auribacterota bacterium]
PSDIKRAAALILSANPFGGVCGMVCPDRHCMAACVHKNPDFPIHIPALQATIIHQAREMKVMPKFAAVKLNGKKAAVIGAGPAGLASAVALARKGYEVDVFEKRSESGGTVRCIPSYRLRRDMLDADIALCLSLGKINLQLKKEVKDPKALLKKGYAAVLVAAGLWAPIKLGIRNEELAVSALEYLSRPEKFKLRGRVAVIGGGATASDCAVTAAKSGADFVEMFALENVGEMPLTAQEREELLKNRVDINGRIKVTAIRARKGKVTGLDTVKVTIPPNACFSLKCISEMEGCEQTRGGFDHVIVAIGSRSAFPRLDSPGLFYAGDMISGP